MRSKLPGRVFACLRTGEIQIALLPGVGLADGGIPYDVPLEIVPFELRAPNTEVWLRLDKRGQIVEVWRRESDSPSHG